MRQRVPCESARQLLDVMLRDDVILAAATALWSGSSDCTHPSAPGGLPEIKRTATIQTQKLKITIKK